MERHHIVQEKYLRQWQNNKNQLQIFSIPENKYLERGPSWQGFYRKDFNVLDDKKHRYLPEQVTSQIDRLGMDAIRKIDVAQQNQLGGEDRSALAFYVALQYIRTPRHREEANKMLEQQLKFLMRKDISSPEDVSMTKEEILRHQPANKKEEEAMKKVANMSDKEIQEAIFSTIHGDDLKIKLTKEGHSKSILKVERQAKEIFEFQWLFLIAPSGSPFITSDSPCFTISPTRMMNGLLSPQATIIFPLRPDVCVYIKPRLKSKTEHYMALDAEGVRAINKFIITHSHHLVVATSKKYLEKMTQDYDVNKHKSSRDVSVSENGNYVMFNLE